MRYERLFAFILSLMLLVMPIATVLADGLPEETETTQSSGVSSDQPPEVAPIAETTPSNAPETTPTETPETTPSESPEASPSDSPEATPSESPEASPSDSPEATQSESPETTPTTSPEATPTITDTPTDMPPQEVTLAPAKQYPRIVFQQNGVVYDLNNVRQGGYILVGLPIGIELGEGYTIWTNLRGTSGANWTLGSEPAPGYFTQDINQHLTSAKWRIESYTNSTGVDGLDFSGGTERDIFAAAPQNNPWGLPAGSIYNAGYAVFNLPIKEDAPAGRYSVTFLFEMPSFVVNANEEIRYTVQFTLNGAPTQPETQPPTQEPTQTPTNVPNQTQNPNDPNTTIDPNASQGPASQGQLMVGQTEVQTLKVRQKNVTLAVPVSYVLESSRFYSNLGDNGMVVEPGADFTAYNQDIAEYVDWLEISVSAETVASEAFPFTLSEQGVARTVIADGNNYGYAVFSGLTVKSNLANGAMAVPLTARWREAGDDTVFTTNLSTLVNITGASTGGGGGGGGGGVSTPTTPPQARVLVESLTTNPKEVKAGDTFDIVMTLRNTSVDQYVQNMRVTISSEEDTLIPLSGSNALYIDRIEKDSTYEITYPVRANMQVPDHPIKVDVNIEYEDANVAAQTAAQTLTVDVAENRRVKIDEPVLDNMSPMSGDSVTASLQVINEGRTMLYNVTVAAQCDNEDIILPVSSYLGNMEGGTSKKAELDLIPTASGDYEITFQISYEDAMGMPYTETKTTSFYAQEEEYYDPYEDINPMPEGEPSEEQGLTAQGIMQMLPWWIYALCGGILVILVLLMGLSARGRHRKALEDDEMD